MALNNIDAAVQSYKKALELEPTDGKEHMFFSKRRMRSLNFIFFDRGRNFYSFNWSTRGTPTLTTNNPT